jgi:hypothetical protein
VNVGKKTFAPFVQEDGHLWPRLFAPEEPVDFGWVKTREAFRLVTETAGRTKKRCFPAPVNEDQTAKMTKKHEDKVYRIYNLKLHVSSSYLQGFMVKLGDSGHCPCWGKAMKKKEKG